MSDVGELAKVIWNTSRADESTISATGANIVARAILASDWLAQREADLAADERERIAQAIEALPKKCDNVTLAARIARDGGTA